jgi:DDE superfamily endonuclease
MVLRSYAPVGKTPLLEENLTRDHLSAMSAITLDGKFYMIEHQRSFKAEDAVRFLKHLMRQMPAKLLVVWEGSPIHRGGAVKDFLARAGQLLGLNWSNCQATLRISRPRGGGLEAPQVCGALKNLCSVRASKS